MIIYEIKQRIKDDLVENFKEGNTNGYSPIIEDIQTIFPNTITSDIFIGVDGVQVGPEEFEIAGRQAPTLNEYIASIAIRLTSGDSDYGEEELARVMRRVWKVIYTSDLRARQGQDTITNLDVTEDGIRERVTHAFVVNSQTDSGPLATGEEMAYVGVILIRVRTNIVTIN